VAGDGQATVSFTPPASDGGSAITSYTVTSTPGDGIFTGSDSPIVVSGLTNGTTYTFTVDATNGVGTSAPSAASIAVTPTAAPTEPTDTYLQVHFDQTKYRPSDVAVVTVMAHGYPAGLASVAVEMHYDMTVFGEPSTEEDFLTGGLMEGASDVTIDRAGHPQRLCYVRPSHRHTG